jgi:hypothetical protein
MTAFGQARKPCAVLEEMGFSVALNKRWFLAVDLDILI